MPRFVCFRSAVDLPSLTLAALRAEAFLVAPTWWRKEALHLVPHTE